MSHICPIPIGRVAAKRGQQMKPVRTVIERTDTQCDSVRVRFNDHPKHQRTSPFEAGGHAARNTMTARPMLVLNPTHDGAFGAAAHTLLGHGGLSLDAFQDGLRQTYPNVVVRARDLSGEAVAWYVFREGHWIDGGPLSKR